MTPCRPTTHEFFYKIYSVTSNLNTANTITNCYHIRQYISIDKYDKWINVTSKSIKKIEASEFRILLY